MDKLRERYFQLTKQKAPRNISKTMLDKYISWYSQLRNKQEKELRSLLKGHTAISNISNATFVREYQGKKHEFSIIDGGFFYKGQRYKSLSKIAREITGTNWNGKLFFKVTGT